jgi:hypothetical protein
MSPRLVPIVLLLAAVALPAAGRAVHAETAASDPRAVRIADEVMTALGGKERWEKLPGLRWSFEVFVHDTLRSYRHHAWDMRTGVERVDGRTRAGEAFCFIHTVGGEGGMAWMGGHAIEGDSLAKLMKTAQSLWTNDSYWFLVTEGDTTYDKLSLSFDHVGETPGDHYWVYVNRKNHRIEKWDFILQSQKPPATTWTWEGWEEHGGLWFPTVHRNGASTLYTRAVEAVTSFEPDEFKAP